MSQEIVYKPKCPLCLKDFTGGRAILPIGKSNTMFGELTRNYTHTIQYECINCMVNFTSNIITDEQIHEFDFKITS